MSVWRVVSILVLWVGSSLGASAESERQAESPLPNIVLIVSDDQGYNDLGLINDGIITPHLDRIAKEGVRLSNFHVAWPACTPSRGAFLSGRYPQRNGIYDMIRNEAPDYGYKYSPEEYAVTFERIGGMDTREILIPELLKQAGYVSGIFGKWDLGSLQRFLPRQRGFDEFYGLVNTGIDYYTHERYGVPSMYRNDKPTTEDKGTYCTYLFQREAVRFLKENRERPFFLYVPFNAPHGASNLDPKIRGLSQSPEKWRKMYPEFHEREGYTEGQRYGKPAMRPNQAMRQAHYLGSVTAMDAAIGEILDMLDEYELTDNTIVIFFSDNGGCGPADDSPLRGGKARMFEGGVRVLSLVRYPPRLAAGTVCDEFLTSLELFPTLLNLAGVESPAGIKLDGFDMLPVLAGDKASTRTEMYWKRRNKEAARVGNWKWVRNAHGTHLFNLADDLSEQNNLAETMPRKTAELEAKFKAWLHETMVEAEPRRPFKDF
ncbi:MAG: sulfatase-like hydrolase/transferase [Planctomycetota bacterium]